MISVGTCAFFMHKVYLVELQRLQSSLQWKRIQELSKLTTCQLTGCAIGWCLYDDTIGYRWATRCSSGLRISRSCELLPAVVRHSLQTMRRWKNWWTQHQVPSLPGRTFLNDQFIKLDRSRSRPAWSSVDSLGHYVSNTHSSAPKKPAGKLT